MPIDPGTKLGAYEVLAPVGAGGMGEVYKAKDTRLDRTVALKVLPSELSDNAELRQRFEQEARAVSSLNHPHICILHDIGSENGVDFLVMEYIEGETLLDRLKRGPLPLEQVVRYGVEIADALDTAHRQGVVHRDLKPGNIIITKSGAKLLDFGLAKQLRGPLGDDSGSASSVLPTEAKPLTEKGAVLGTFQYMAPEQLEGKDADARTDVFALGALLYEMTTGHKAFHGESTASLIGAIMNTQPTPPSERVTASPPLLDHVIETCLAKEPDERWQSSADVGRSLSWVARQTESAPVAAAARWKGMIVAGVVGAIVAGSIAWLTTDAAPPPGIGRTEFFMPLPPTDEFPALAWIPALSPDGRMLVYAAIRDNVQHLFKRSMGSSHVELIERTEGATGPFFSPDGEWIGFWADQKLKKMSLDGGVPITLVDGVPRIAGGASWGPDDSIIFTTPHGVSRIPADGGDAEPFFEGDGELFYPPVVLPRGRAFLFARFAMGVDETPIHVVPFDSKEPLALLIGAQPEYSSTGHIVFGKEGSIWAAPFDETRLELTGRPFVVATPGYGDRVRSTAAFAVGGHGALAYTSGKIERTMLWVDREGRVEHLREPPSGYLSPRISPDGNRVAVDVDGTGGITVVDLRRGGRTRIDDTYGGVPVWTRDGRGLASFAAMPGDSGNAIVIHSSDGSGEPTIVTTRPVIPVPGSWHPDGETLAFHEINGISNRDIWLVTGSSDPVPYLTTPANERTPAFSHDGRFIAYVSDESGRDEVYVETYPERTDRLPISTEGGIQPVWSPAGNEIFYRYGTRMMAVTITTSPEITASRPTVLFEGRYATGNPHNPNYAVTPDGERFLMIEEDPASLGYHIVLNAFENVDDGR